MENRKMNPKIGSKKEKLTVEDIMTASPEELLGAACQFYLRNTTAGDRFVAGIRLGFKIADPDSGWQEIAPAWLEDYLRSTDPILQSIYPIIGYPPLWDIRRSH